jgi:hypothetical protein
MTTTDSPLITCYICGDAQTEDNKKTDTAVDDDNMIGCLQNQDAACNRFKEKFNREPEGYLHVCEKCEKRNRHHALRVMEKYGVYGVDTKVTPSPWKKQHRMPKTVRTKFVVIDGKEYIKCPYEGCDYMVENRYYDPKSEIHSVFFPAEQKVYTHIREEHGYVWLSKGGRSGWWPLSKFHPRPEGRE